MSGTASVIVRCEAQCLATRKLSSLQWMQNETLRMAGPWVDEDTVDDE